ncbi:hypothetical protein DPEC_G00105980 [Dallia pectoralis]|uniref:Uncharacterized protein n=1 Tax=Dallia pectoralis TaxID=75939 RepID=A0ACC2GXW3_DALPE|nr:hypothetical protein DPEC_G00105980 [Dallia pectoralis]
MSGGADVVCQGWLRKSPPEKKLRRYAWKRRWFVLRSGRLTGNPDVLEYYKHDHARKPIRIINMSLCEQVDAGLTFNQKDLDSSYVFDVRTLDRVFYLVANSEEDMNRWVRSICDLCGFNPTENEMHTVATQSAVVTVTTGHALVSMATSTFTDLPLYESVSSEEDRGTEYLWLLNCQSKTPQRPPTGSTSSDTTENSDNTLPSHLTPPTSSPSSLVNGLPSHPQPHTAPWAVAKETNHFNHSQDSTATPDLHRGWTRGHPSPHPRKHSLQLQAVPLTPMCNDVVFNTGGANTINSWLNGSISNSSYQVPRALSVSSVGSDLPGLGYLSSTPPPRPPKPLTSAPAEVSSLGPVSARLPQMTSEPDRSYGGEERGASICGIMATPDCCQADSQENHPVPWPVPERTRAVPQRTRPVAERTRPSKFDFTDSFNNYFMNKGMVPLSGQTDDDGVDENYVAMSASDPSLASSSSPSSLAASSHELPSQHTNYVSMTPCPGELPALGRQVPPPAHLVFRSSPVPLHTPPQRRHTTGGGGARGGADTRPPPIHRNLKPRKVKPAPLNIRPLQEWEELPAPVRSPVTRTFTRDPSSSSLCPLTMSSSCPSTASSSDSDDPDDNYVAMTTSSLAPPAVESKPCHDSPMILRRPRGDKEVEYLDLDIQTSGAVTPPRQKKTGLVGSMGSMSSSGGERARGRVDYVVVDPERTRALKSTREAWHDGRIEKEK